MSDETPVEDASRGPSGMMTLEELAEYLNRSGHPVALRTLRDHCSAGVLRAKKIRRTWYVSSDEIPAYARFLDQPEPIVRGGAPRSPSRPAFGTVETPVEVAAVAVSVPAPSDVRNEPSSSNRDQRIVQEDRDTSGRLRALIEWTIGRDGRRQRSGRYERYAPSGRKVAEGRYVADLLDGPWREWSDEGTLEVEGSHLRGRPVGLWTNFAASGEKIFEGTYRDGLAHGVWTFFAADGRVLREIDYVDGAAVAERSAAPSKS